MGMLLAIAVLGRAVVADPAVNFILTLPGPQGAATAFVAEAAMAFVLMLAVLVLSNRPRWNRYTGAACGALVALFLAVEAPLSGMSINPARSFASAWVAGRWNDLWIYFTAPPLGMLLAAGLYLRLHGLQAVLCCKLHHDNPLACIFRCRYGEEAMPT